MRQLERSDEAKNAIREKAKRALNQEIVQKKERNRIKIEEEQNKMR